MSPQVLDSTEKYEQLFALIKAVESRTKKRLTRNTWRDACESQQDKLNLFGKITQAKADQIPH
jgi:hypothetical protein